MSAVAWAHIVAMAVWIFVLAFEARSMYARKFEHVQHQRGWMLIAIAFIAIHAACVWLEIGGSK